VHGCAQRVVAAVAAAAVVVAAVATRVPHDNPSSGSHEGAGKVHHVNKVRLDVEIRQRWEKEGLQSGLKWVHFQEKYFSN
jgi:hypothetical protein